MEYLAVALLCFAFGFLWGRMELSPRSERICPLCSHEYEGSPRCPNCSNVSEYGQD